MRLRSWVLALQMSADKLKLMKGESTAFHVFIKSVETIPQEAWFGSGEVPDFMDPAIIRKFLPDFKLILKIDRKKRQSGKSLSHSSCQSANSCLFRLVRWQRRRWGN